MENNKVSIEYHADDFGLFPMQSQEILDCYRNGCLNGISVMPNSPYLKACMKFIEEEKNDIKIAIHLNFMEGKCVSPPETLNLLVDETGVFYTSFGKLLLHSFLPGKARYKEQLKREILAQIKAVIPYLDNRSLRIDSHSHYHMIPIVFDSLVEILKEENLSIEYIRVPQEKLKLYFLKNLNSIRFINIVKSVVLNILAERNLRKHRTYLSSMENRLFIGVMLSGNMTLHNVQILLPNAVQAASRTERGIEILAHPGGVFQEEDIAQLTHLDDKKFLTSNQRKKEKEMFCLLYQ